MNREVVEGVKLPSKQIIDQNYQLAISMLLGGKGHSCEPTSGIIWWIGIKLDELRRRVGILPLCSKDNLPSVVCCSIRVNDGVVRSDRLDLHDTRLVLRAVGLFCSLSSLSERDLLDNGRLVCSCTRCRCTGVLRKEDLVSRRVPTTQEELVSQRRPG